MSWFSRVLDALSGIGPDVFQAEVAAGLAYAVVLFNLHIDDAHKAAFLGAAVMVYTLTQGLYKVAAKKSSAPDRVVAASAGK